MSRATIEIGEAQTRELDAILEILCEAFQMPPDAARPIFYQDPYFNPANKRVLRVEGRVVSCLTIVERECNLGAGVVRLGGIAGVATRTAERSQGYAGRLLADTIQVLRARAVGLSALIPASREFYRRYGWEIAGNGHRYLTAPAHLSAFPERQNVRPARPEDIADLSRLYTEWTSGRALCCLRDRKRWQFILDNVKQRMVYVPPNRAPEGYLLYDFLATDAGGMETASRVTLPPTLRILEMHAATPEARRGLIGFLASQTQAGCIEYVATPGDFLRDGLLGLRSGAAGLDALASVEIAPTLMARVIDPVTLAKALSANWQDFVGALQIEIRDPLAPGGASAVLIEGNGRAPRVRPAPDTVPDARTERIQGDVRAWSQVFVGHLGADDACALGLLQPITPNGRALASSLFPERAPFLPLTDHF